MSLGPPIRKEPPPKPEWVPVPGKPHMWRNAQGQFKYTPPLPVEPAPYYPWGILSPGADGDDDAADCIVYP